MDDYITNKILVSVLRRADALDCTLGGVTSNYADVMLYASEADYLEDIRMKAELKAELNNGTGSDHFLRREFPTPPALIMCEKRVGPNTYKYCYPAKAHQNKPGSGCMSGGNFVYTCDSRFSDVTGGQQYPISVHDRQE